MAAEKIRQLYTYAVENLIGNDDRELIKKKKDDDYESSAARESILTPESPWLLLPSPLSSSEALKFYNVFDGRIHQSNLPAQLHGGRVCGSSKGWLVIAKEEALILFNPVSGDCLELPSLLTLPNFHNLYRPNANSEASLSFFHMNYNNQILDTQTKVSMFIHQVELSLEDPRHPDCVVAAVLDYKSVLVCCKPASDKNWTVLHGSWKDNKKTSYNSADVDLLTVIDSISFCYQTLYLFTYKRNSQGSSSTPGSVVVAEAYNVRVGDDGSSYMLRVNCLPEYLLHRGQLRDETNVFANIHVRVDRFLHLQTVESKDKNGQVLLVYKHINHGFIVDEKGHDRPNHSYLKTRRFQVLKLIPCLHSGNSFTVEKVNSIGDDGVLFVGGGSTSIHHRHSDQLTRGNCVYFIDDTRYECRRFNPLVSFDTGVFYLDDEKIKRPFPSVQLPTQSRMFWLKPNHW